MNPLTPEQIRLEALKQAVETAKHLDSTAHARTTTSILRQAQWFAAFISKGQTP